ncbi:hypothetical protein [Halopiger goleimassiliensis]|uniref:hypothetical protein n=1 Tax=Halopiger goleimassiliensis TaxID=1293048 RepID=UPI000678058D|nr:hypothetical protein [Halopiger goleimassiliensis]
MSPQSDDGSRRTPSRRRMLRWSALGGLALLSGCTRDVGEELPPNLEWPIADLTPELPVQERTDVLEAGIEELASRTITDEAEFAAAIEDYSLEVESVEYERDVLTIEYVNTNVYEEGNVHDVGPIAGAFAALLDSGYEAVALGITILDAAPSSYGAAEVDAAWAYQYNDGVLSAKEYGELVAGTIESDRHEPHVAVEPDE